MKVLIVHSGNCDDELRQARMWLEAEGCEGIVFDLKDSGWDTRQKSLTEIIAECDVAIFLVNSEMPLDEIQLGVVTASAMGKKIVGVQLGVKISIEAFEKYGSASIPFKQNLLVGAVCGDQFAWTDEEGNPRDDQDMEYHKCRKSSGGKDARA
jgi:hypothetical protein